MANLNSKLQVWSTEDGRNPANKVYPMKRPAITGAQAWEMKLDGENHTLVFEGDFDFTTVTARSTFVGKR